MNFKAFFLLLTFLCISCTVEVFDKLGTNEVLSGPSRITNDDIISVDGDLRLGLTLDEARGRGISEEVYKRTEKHLDGFNERTKKTLQDTLSHLNREYHPIQVAYGYLQSPVASTGFDGGVLGGLASGEDFLLMYEFDSEMYCTHHLYADWFSRMPQDFYQYTMSYAGIYIEEDVGYSIELLYECDSMVCGSCAWRLFQLVVLSDDK